MCKCDDEPTFSSGEHGNHEPQRPEVVLSFGSVSDDLVTRPSGQGFCLSHCEIPFGASAAKDRGRLATDLTTANVRLRAALHTPSSNGALAGPTRTTSAVAEGVETADEPAAFVKHG